MLAVLDHPKLAFDWFTTTLLRWADGGLVVYERWLISANGISAWSGSGGEVLLDFYYTCYLIAFVGVLYFFHRFRKQGWIKVRAHVGYDALLLAMIGVLVGAKTAYIFIYNPAFYFGPPPYGPADTSDQLRRIFLNWSGMASHGAAAGVLLMSLLWWLRSRPPMAIIGDIGGISAAFGAIWIRLANFMNAELYGRAADPGLPWAMRFPVRSGKGFAVVESNGVLFERMLKPEDPAQLQAWLQTLQQANPGGVVDFGGAYPYVLYKNPDAYLQGYELAVRTEAGTQYLAPADLPLQHKFSYWELVTTPRHPSQLYQLVLEGVLLFLFVLWVRKRAKRAGMVVAAFFTGYPLARFIGEFWRQPDVQFQQHGNELGTVFAGLSMGQILSLLMACAGLSFLVYFSRKGKVIADMQMWPPDKKPGALSVPFETGTGGSSAAGDLQGITEVRAALAEKEKEWDRQAGASPTPPKPEAETKESP